MKQCSQQPSYIAFRFRAECESDVHLFLSAIGWEVLEVDISAEPNINEQGFNRPFPDRDVSMKLAGNLTLENLRWVAEQLTDCHVIADTIQLSEKYDGERLYGEYSAAEPVQHLSKIASRLLDYQEYLQAQVSITRQSLGALCGSYESPLDIANRSA